MKTVKLILIIGLAFLAVSCTEGTTAPPTAPPPTAPSPTISFDFDTGSPALSSGKSTPFDQMSGGVTAHFGSPSDPAAFSVQRGDITFLSLSRFAGNYLYQNSLSMTSLSIRFSQPLTSINLSFATVDSHGVGEVEEPTGIKLTAYMDSAVAPSIGSATARGTLSSDTYPQGTLSFNPAGDLFNIVVIELLPQPGGTTVFLVDNIEVVESEG